MRITQSILWFLLAAGVVLTIWGLTHMIWPGALPFDGAGLRRYIIFILSSSLLVLVGARMARHGASPIFIGSVVSIGYSLLAGALWPFIVSIWFVLSSVILGGYILSVLRAEKNANNWVTYFLVGAGAYGIVVGLLAHLPVNYPAVYGAILIAPLVLGWRTILAIGNDIRVTINKRWAFRTLWFDAAIAVICLIYIIMAFMPELGYDALVMHLFIPSQLFFRHQWSFDASRYAWAVMPMLGDWIFSIGYMLGGETAARLINVEFIFALGWFIRELVVWAGGNSNGARWAVLIFLSMPLTFTEGSNLFVESVWVSYVISGTFAILKLCSGTASSKSSLSLVGVLFGYALSAKEIAMVTMPFLALILIIRYKVWLKIDSMRPLLTGIVLLIATGCIPYVTAYWITGNPVFPFYNKIFKSDYYPDENFLDNRWREGISWKSIYLITFSTEKYLEARPGAVGFQWLTLLLPTLLISILSRHKRLITLYIIGTIWFVLTFHFESYLRYVFPSLALFSAGIGVGISLMSLNLIKAANVVAGVVVGLNMLFINAGPNGYNNFPTNSLLSESDRQSFLQNHLPIRSAVKLVNDLNVAQTPVAFFSAPFGAGLASDALYPNWYNHKFEALISSIGSDRDVARVLQSNNVNFVILDNNWSSSKRRNLIKKATYKIADFGSISVRALRQKYLFKNELLKNTNFSPLDGWHLQEGVLVMQSGELVVSEPSYAVQIVPVVPGRHYLNTIKARCKDQWTQGRIQVNWLDSSYHFISTNIQQFDCANSLSEHSMVVTAPRKSAYAGVFASGQTSTKLIFSEESFRQ